MILKIFRYKFIVLLVFITIVSFRGVCQVQILKNQNIEISIDGEGNLVSLKNLHTGQNYASGKPLWRLYFDRKNRKEIEILPTCNEPEVRKDENEILVNYDHLVIDNQMLHVELSFSIILEENQVRFCSEIANNELHTIVRELQYPLVGNCQLPAGHQLITVFRGGQLYPDPKAQILKVSNTPPYMAPSQYYRQLDLKYPEQVGSNCFVFAGKEQGLYIGSHDSTFQDTWHGLRLYPDKNGRFDELEAGLYKYPNCMAGQTWECDANVVAPYSGDWHHASKIYRNWANTWWEHREAPLWVQKMKSWQRIILRHQYGETFFRYSDMGGRIKDVGESVGCDVVFPFGWWESGMDNGNPGYETDRAQGGDEGWGKAISTYKKDGGKVLLYFNGKLIDRESEYYKSGEGKEVCYKDNTGAEINEWYKFKGMGTFTGYFNSRTFVVADTRNPKWQKQLLDMADKALHFGADAVFYDQLGRGESTTNWDLNREFPVPNTRIIADKGNALKLVHNYIDKKDKDFAIGIEWFTDFASQYVDFIHNIYGATGPTDFIDWTRYTFPEVILSDREIRDDTDIKRRVNHAVLKGLRNDIEIYRCRDLIDKTPVYQQYLAKINEVKDKYCALLLQGKYCDTEGFTLDNEVVEARSFIQDDQMAIVLTQSTTGTVSVRLTVPGYRYVESTIVGGAEVGSGVDNQQKIILNSDDLVVMIFKKGN